MALAGGVNLLLSSEASESLRRAGFLSSACRTFDASADGYCRSVVHGVGPILTSSHLILPHLFSPLGLWLFLLLGLECLHVCVATVCRSLQG